MSSFLIKIVTGAVIGIITASILRSRSKEQVSSLAGVIVAGVIITILLLIEQMPSTPINITITEPTTGASVEMTYIVKGSVGSPKAKIYVLIHPISTSLYWVQNSPNVDFDGSWESTCYFGTESEGVSESYEILALAYVEDWYRILNKNIKLKSGDVLKELPPNFNQSNIVKVIRKK